MSLWLTIAVNVSVAVICVLLNQSSFWGVVNLFTFHIPYTKLMEEKGIILHGIKGQLLFVKGFGAIFFFVLSVVLSFMLGYWARPSGFIVSAIVTLLSIWWFKPNVHYDIVNVQRYYRSHHVCMATVKFEGYLQNEFGMKIDELMSLDSNRITELARIKGSRQFNTAK